jgi:acetyl esterase
MTAPRPGTEPLPARARIEGRLARLLGGLPGAWLLRLIGEPPRVIDGLTLDPHVQFILATRRRRPSPSMCGPTPEVARLRNRREIQAVTISAGARPTRVRSVRELTVDGAAGPLAARHYAPPADGSDVAPPLLVFFHGGGFVICDLDTHDEACRILCRTAGVQVLSVAYRLAPEHPFPAAVEDCHAATRWAQAHAAALGANPARVCVGGDSAGANLAAVTALTLAREERPVCAQLLIYPTTDAAAERASHRTFSEGFVLTAVDLQEFQQHYLGAAADRLRTDPRVSPAQSPDLALAPPTLVITAGFDPLRDEGEAFAQALTAVDVPVRLRREAGLVHGFLHMTTVVPAAHAAVVAMGAALKEMLPSSGPE